MALLLPPTALLLRRLLMGLLQILVMGLLRILVMGLLRILVMGLLLILQVDFFQPPMARHLCNSNRLVLVQNLVAIGNMDFVKWVKPADSLMLALEAVVAGGQLLLDLRGNFAVIGPKVAVGWVLNAVFYMKALLVVEAKLKKEPLSLKWEYCCGKPGIACNWFNIL